MAKQKQLVRTLGFLQVLMLGNKILGGNLLRVFRQVVGQVLLSKR